MTGKNKIVSIVILAALVGCGTSDGFDNSFVADKPNAAAMLRGFINRIELERRKDPTLAVYRTEGIFGMKNDVQAGEITQSSFADLTLAVGAAEAALPAQMRVEQRPDTFGLVWPESLTLDEVNGKYSRIFCFGLVGAVAQEAYSNQKDEPAVKELLGLTKGGNAAIITLLRPNFQGAVGSIHSDVFFVSRGIPAVGHYIETEE